jgi:hypothetical protein
MASPPTFANTGGSHGLRPRTPLAVAGAIVLAGAVIAASVLIGISIGSQRSPATTGPTPGATATTSATTAPTMAPTAPATAQPAPVPLVGFSAGPIAGGATIAGQVTSVGSVRAAAQSGYDRFVMDLGQSPLQRYEVRTQATSNFTLDPKGEVVTLEGSRGVQVVLRDASNHASFSGATDVQTGLPAIREARLTGDFEGVVTWSLGVDGPGFVRVMTLTGPNRLVVDVQR